MIPLGVLAQRQAASGAASFDFIGHASTTTSGLVHTFASQPIGDAAADRRVILVVVGQITASAAATFNGTSMMWDVDYTGVSNTSVLIGHIAVPTGATADVVVTDSGTTARTRVSIGLWRVTGGALAVVDTGSGADPGLYLDVQAGDIAIAARYSTALTTWAGVTERYDSSYAIATDYYTAADTTATATGTLAISRSGGLSTVGAASVAYRIGA